MRRKCGNLRPIAMEYLFDGMVVGEDIFNYNTNILLLAKGVVLTENKIKQLKNYNDDNRNISVQDMTYKTLIEHGMTAVNTLGQEYLEESVGYTKIKDATADMLDNVKRTDAISKEETDGIAGEMFNKLYDIDPSLIFQCINAPNPIDEYLRRHSINVALLNGLMGRWLGLPDDEISLLVLSGLVHDVGKTKIPSEILNAPRRLTTCEFEVIKMHTVYSYELLCKDEHFPLVVKLAARNHHERTNGAGYPDGLKSDTISRYAKISAVSDVYDAMISKRSYKDADNPFLVLTKLANQQFSGLDMGLVNFFIEHMPAELVGKSVLLSDGSIGTIKFLVANDLEHPLVEVNGRIKKMDANLYCMRVVLD